MGGTKLIFVVGQSGTGKTTMLQELTGMDLKVGVKINSGTMQYQVCPAIIHGEQYLFVDTAGFGAADMNDIANFEDICNCLEALSPFVTVAGVLFVYGHPKTRMSKEDLKTVQWIECFCGPEFYRNVTIVTSQWDALSLDGVETTWESLDSLLAHHDVDQILNPPDPYYGGSVYHHGFPRGEGSVDAYPTILSLKRASPQRGDELKDLIRRRYADSKPAKLQIVCEVESGTPRLETEAAKALKADVICTKICILNSRVVVSVEGNSQQPPISPEAPSTAPTQVESWFEKLSPWLETAKQAAVWFMEARWQGHESSNRKDSSAGPVWSLLGTFQDWWWGPPKKSRPL
ncbi:MAG: hypothetical protein M1834_007629 [Cirrosporium novae-zelandiae]|nr:MAG: hypothetical protein M1834_007629 [Cirrosporium novae-zelandiae]